MALAVRQRRADPVELNIREKSETNVRAIIDNVVGALAKGALRPGDRLPNERAMCDKYGAARHTVRKALNILERGGVVARYVGRGSFIVDNLPPDLNNLPARGKEAATGSAWSLAEMTEARLLFEPGFADLVIQRAEPHDLDEIEACLAHILSAQDWREFKERKYAFHLAIARATKNDFLAHIFEQIVSSRRQANWSRTDSQVHGLDAAKEISLRENRAILDGLRRRDAAAAGEAIRQGLMRIMASISEL